MIAMIKLQRSRCSILPLVLKGKWFDMIERGEKREEYRLPTLGYARDAPRMAFWCMGIETVGGLMPYGYVDATVTYRRHPE